jgi:uncharacterized protein
MADSARQTHMTTSHTITPRERLDFDLQGDIAQYWLGGDAFKSRYFDAMSVIFPEGERFFIACVRDFRDQIDNPQLQEQVKDFIRQEAQHGMVHTQFNDRLKAQGIDVDFLERIQKHFSFNVIRKYLPKKHTLAVTAAAEHMTAIMAHSFFDNKETLAKADRRIRAMYAWHAMEEIEHKAVAFDVMQKVARVGYLRRVWAMVEVSFIFQIHVMLVTNYMFKRDGFSAWQRAKLWGKGLWWLFGYKGLYAPIVRYYFKYYQPGFHPWKSGQMKSYETWINTFNTTGDPLAAGDALMAA